MSRTHPLTSEPIHAFDFVVKAIGAGKDPWGGYRRGFSGSTKLLLTDFGITKNLGPASAQVELILDVEGIRQ